MLFVPIANTSLLPVLTVIPLFQHLLYRRDFIIDHLHILFGCHGAFRSFAR
jgi:hypothetical protein